MRPVKAGVFSRRQSCQGKSQKPCSLDSKVMGDQDLEAYRQRHLKDGDESPGRSESEHIGGPENEKPGGRARNREGEGSRGSRKLTEAAVHSSGVVVTAW